MNHCFFFFFHHMLCSLNMGIIRLFLPVLFLQLTGYYEYKAPGVLEDFPPDLLADVNMDSNYRKEQDEFVQELYEKECNGEAVVYWEVESPSPKFSRDYIYVQQRREPDHEGLKIHVILAQSTSVPQFPERWGVIRVEQYQQRLVIQSDGERGNKAKQRNEVPKYLKNMVNACYNYHRRT